MLSCPLHGCWLESYWGVPGRFLGWENADAEPRTASDAIAAMDQRTWQALTTGHVELPRRRIHAGLWFRLLRTLLDELNTPLSTCGTYAGYLRQIWECCGHPLRAGQSLWRPYETLNPAVRLQMLEAAATAISLIEVRDISPPGEHAKLFWSGHHFHFNVRLPNITKLKYNHCYTPLSNITNSTDLNSILSKSSCIRGLFRGLFVFNEN